MKIHYLICLLFIQLVFSQKSNTVRGNTIFKTENLENVTVKNLNNNEFQVTDKQGYFEISAKQDDVLAFYLLGFKTDSITITQKDLVATAIKIEMKLQINELKEVIINKTNNINALSLGIISKEVKPLTLYERRLKTAGDFKPIQLLGLLGGSLPLDPIINKINGRTKEIKKNIEVEKKEKNLLFLKNNYFDYISNTLKISKESISSFLYFVVEKENRDLSKDNSNQIEFLLSNYKSSFMEVRE